MKSYIKVSSWGALTTLLLAGALTYAQQEKIEDQDLLNLINSVKPDSSTPETKSADTPISRAKETLIAVGERGDDADLVTSESDSEEMEVIMDDLQITIADENIASSVGNLISVRLNRVGLEEAINLFAQLSGANIIVPELTEAAQISVNLKDVEWRPALQSILDTYSYELFQKVSGSNIFSIRRRPPGAPEPQLVETFTLKYATVPNAAALIRELLPQDAKVSEFASRNMIVVKSSESSLSEVRAVLESIDKVRQQVFIESKFMELSDDAQKDLGIDWSVLQAYSAGTAGSTTRSSVETDRSTQTDSSFTDVNGLAYEDASGYANLGQRIAGSGLFTLEGVTPAASRAASETTTEVLTSVLSADEFRLVLSALEQNKGVNIVSNPKVIVANEELANISIVRKEPNLKQEREQQLTDQPATTTFTLDENMPFFEYGIKLDVLPSINTSSNITIQINPSLTRKFADKQAGEITYPVIDEKSIKTVFNLASGQTAAIGGLTEVTEGEEEKKVPVLGNIPFLGRLFSWKQTIRGQSETIIFVTVGLANTQDINIETGMPGDAELARRQIIRDKHNRALRDSGRQYYEAEENDKLRDMMQVMKQKEDERVERRVRALMKEKEKAAKDEGKEAEVTSEMASNN
ncbi:MAG: secretin N-terminal domain-containing protein [Pontiella sp.]